MAPDELVDAYVSGRISRRVFVRRLAATGLAVSTAVAYANLLTPDGALAAERKGSSYYAQHYYKPKCAPKPKSSPIDLSLTKPVEPLVSRVVKLVGSLLPKA